MKRVGIFAALSIALAATLASPARSDEAIPVAKGSVAPGDGQAVTFKGNPLPLSGTAVKIGEPLPAAMLTGGNMAPVNIAHPHGQGPHHQCGSFARYADLRCTDA